MKKKLLQILPIIFPSSVLARTDLGLQDMNTEDISGIDQLINNVLQILQSMAYIVAVIMIIIGGFFYITSAGNPDRAKQGKNYVAYAVGGFIVFLLAKYFVRFFAGLIGGGFS